MSTTEKRIPLEQAIDEAERFRALFEGCYDRWEFAGSIRRRRDTIGDIEHVVIARAIARIGDAALFGAGETQYLSAIRERADDLLRSETLTLHDYNGRTRNGEIHFGVDLNGTMHEVFTASHETWGSQLLIHTGSAAFSRGIMQRLNRRGYRHADMRLWKMRGPCDLTRPGHRIFEDGRDGELVLCPDEDVLLMAAGLIPEDWPPEKREVEA